MPSQLDIIMDKIKVLENELIEELQKQQQEFFYILDKKRIYFEDSTIIQHKEQAKKILKYFADASLKNIISLPFIWLCIVPLILMDMSISLYQYTCFPLYNIPKVNRQDYIIFDHQYLNYLNFIEKINCAYCSYANGLIAYVGEIAARTEQFWCPIKHAGRIKNLHSRYQKFIDYGDAKTYQAELSNIRHNFKDLE
jgi:hypothetical protein